MIQDIISFFDICSSTKIKNMKLIKDNSLTPIELARLKYVKLYEQQQIAKAQRIEHLKLSIKNLIFNILKTIN